MGRSQQDRELADRITRLLDRLAPQSRSMSDFFLGHERHFDELARWCDSTFTEKQRADQQNRQLDLGLRRANDEINALRPRLAQTTSLLEQRQHELSVMHDNLTSSHRHEMQRLKEQHETTTYNLQISHAAKVEELDQRIKELLSDIMIAQVDSKAWTDEKLKEKFEELKLTVIKITTPHSTGEIRSFGNLQRQIDPTDFLGREGMGQAHFLLSSVIWSILLEHFFSTSWGFGALGPQRGRVTLLRLYETWRSTFNSANVDSSGKPASSLGPVARPRAAF
jgi:hypothetical protein